MDSCIFTLAGIYIVGIACDTCFELDEDRRKRQVRAVIAGIISFFFGIFLFVVNVFVPSTKDAAAILLVPKIVNNEKVAAIPSKVLDLANDWLDALKSNPAGGKR